VVSLQTFAAGTHTFALRIHYTTWNEYSYRLYVSQPCAIHNIYTFKVRHTFTAGAYTVTTSILHIHITSTALQLVYITDTQYLRLYSWYPHFFSDSPLEVHSIHKFTAGTFTLHFIHIFTAGIHTFTAGNIHTTLYCIHTSQAVSTSSHQESFTAVYHTFTVGIYNLTSSIIPSCVVSTPSK
jgi:hypothetical protein